MVKRLVRHIGNLSGLGVLDVGCGEGKNATYLAEGGALVRAIDVSELALANARLAWKNVTRITWEQADIRTTQFPDETYDIVVAYGLAHCLLSPQEIKLIFTKLQRATKMGGYHAICSFNSRAQDLSAHPGLIPCLVPHEFYLELYSHWSILEATDNDLEEVHPHNNIKHTHSLTRILARKPGS
ncbi:MAG: class I SAM-dependent methyltransferase [Nitrospira sp.]|nr:MAG: class I SAM-dependent methyltransferase [Nitrospira sp.]